VDDTETAFDSMGTAETLMGSIPGVTLDHTHRDSGFLFGRQPVGERLFWLGSAAAAGASVEWVRRLVAMEDQPYAKLNDAVLALPSGPTGITFVPYLNGSNAPHFEPEATGAFFGLMIHHSRAHLIKAVFEGVAMEIEWIRAHACASMGINVKRLRCVGGGTKNSLWLQIKADVCGIPLEVPDLEEATLSGAAQVVSLGCALKERCMREGRSRVRVYQPDEELVQRYRDQYQRTFLPALQAVGLPLSVAGEIH
jgi:sugar (pentulose or hexulose) kinase